jgi:hypothetical protein
MYFEETQKLPTIVLGQLKLYYLLVVEDFPKISIDVALTGTKYLNYYISSKGEKQIRLLVEISEERIKMIASGEMAIDTVFREPEKEIFYSCLFNTDGSIDWLYYVLPEVLKKDCPILPNYLVPFNIESKPDLIDFQQLSIQRKRVTIDIYLNANTLKSNLKYWAIKGFLIPFTELVKTAMLNANTNFSPKNIEQGLNIGYSKLILSSLRSTLEFDFQPNLFNNTRELENLANLYLLFNADSEEDIIKYFDGFINKRIIPEYLKILRIILKNQARFETQIAAPNKFYNMSVFDKDRAERIRKIITEKIPFTEYEEEIKGTLIGLEKKNPNNSTFTISASLEDATYHGKICESLHGKIPEQDFNFGGKEYVFKIKTRYTPETPIKREKYEHTLLEIIYPES